MTCEKVESIELESSDRLYFYLSHQGETWKSTFVFHFVYVIFWCPNKDNTQRGFCYDMLTNTSAWEAIMGLVASK